MIDSGRYLQEARSTYAYKAMKSRVVQLRASPATFQGLMDTDREVSQGREPDLILAFLPPDGSLESTIGAMAEVWPSSRRAGCETVHQFAGSEITTTGCLQLFWLEDEAHRITVEVVEGTQEEPPGEEAIETACRGLAPADAALLLADGLRFPIGLLLNELRRHKASLPQAVIGALASCREPHIDPETKARVFLDSTVYPSACLVLGFEGVTMNARLVQAFQPASPIYTVTRASGETIHEIDDESAVDWHRRFFVVDGRLAPMPQTAHSFPLIIEGPDPARRDLCRAMRAFDSPPGAVTYWGDLREGEQIRLGLNQDLSLVDTANGMPQAHRADAVFVCAFAGREALLGERADSEITDLHNILNQTALAGCFSFGEIGPGHDGSLVLQNQTALLALLEEKTS